MDLSCEVCQKQHGPELVAPRDIIALLDVGLCLIKNDEDV